MICQRCRGLLVCETMEDQNIETHSDSIATRCINCGYIEDAVVRANRSLRSESTDEMSKRRRRVRKISSAPVARTLNNLPRLASVTFDQHVRNACRVPVLLLKFCGEVPLNLTR